MIRLQDRRDAGQRLAAQLGHLKGRDDVVVLGIPRGGVIVADEVARALDAPLDVFITRKIGAPFNPELALGAVASDGTVFVDDELIHQLHIPIQVVEHEKQSQVQEIQRRADLYRGGQLPQRLANKTVVLVDDGVATGATTIAALRAIRKQKPTHLILAVPVAPQQAVAALRAECDELILLDAPDPFHAVGYFYKNFEQTADEQVMEVLREARWRMETGD